MKKILICGAALTLALSLCACGAGGAQTASSAGGSVSAASSADSALEALQSENAELRQKNTELQAQLDAAGGSTSADTESDNPIDKFFAGYADRSATNEMTMVAGAEYDAWHDELTAFVKDLESETSDAADREDLEDYLENAEEQAKIQSDLTLMVAAGADTPRDQRWDSAGSLAPVSIASGGAGIFKDAFYSLYWTRYVGEESWTWRFDAAAAKTALDAKLSKAG